MKEKKANTQRKQNKPLVLAIDQGTTGTTIMVFNASGQVLSRINREYRQNYPKPGWVEHRPDDIWQTVTQLIPLALRHAKAQASQVAAIGITNQRETVMIWDRKTSKPLHNAIVWQDRRTSDACLALKNQGLEKMVREKTGLVLDPYFSATKLQWLNQNVPKIASATAAGTCAAGTVDTFLLWRLTGGRSHKTDVSNGSRTLLMNLKTAAWDNDLCKLFEVNKNVLPEISDSSGELGVTHGLKFLPDGIPISGIAGDQQAALFGQMCFAPGESKCTFGTGSFLLINTGTVIRQSSAGLLSTAAWRLKGEQATTYALEGSAYICGAAVQFLRDQMKFIKRSRDIESLAKSVNDSGGVEFVPALTGIGAPYWNPYARGLICGLTRGTTPAHIARATLEAMALQNAEILLAMRKDLSSELGAVRVDGGAAANNMLMQMQADYIGVDVIRPKIIETTATGAAYLAGIGVGLWTVEDLKKLWKKDRVFVPKMSAATRDARLESWKKAVARANL